jgi:hypothetical protein
MGKNETDLPHQSPSDSIPEINLHNRDKVLCSMKTIKNGFERIKILLTDFKSSNDIQKQESLKARIAINIETITGEISQISKTLGFMQVDVDERRKATNDPKCLDVRLRILSSTVSALQQKLYFLVKDFNVLQIRTKESYRAKMANQLLAFDPNIAEEVIAEMFNDPMVFLQENE